MKRPYCYELIQRLGEYDNSCRISGCGGNARIKRYEFGERMQSYDSTMYIKIIDRVYLNGDLSLYTRTTRKHIKNAYGLSYAEIVDYIKKHPNRVFC